MSHASMTSALRRLTAAALVAAAVPMASAFADDATAQAALDKAKALFAERSATSLKSIDECIAVLQAAESQAEKKELKYDILVLESRALYFKGAHTDGRAAKLDIHSKGQAKADAAEAVSADYAEAPYFAGINLARWGQAYGIVGAATKVPLLKKYMGKAIDRVTRDDKEGESVDGFGPRRTLGRMFHELPELLGGSHAESVKSLDKAVKGAPELALNVVYLGDALIKKGTDAEKAEGRRLLTEMLAKDPNTYNAERVVETVEEFALARDVLAGKEIH